MPDPTELLESARSDEQSIPEPDKTTEVGAAAEPEQPQEKAPPEPPEPPPAPKKHEHIPLKTFLQERDKGKQLAEEIRQLRAEIESLKEGPEPDYDEDPRGYFDHKIKTVEKKVDSFNPEELKQENEKAWVQAQINQDVADAVQKHEDFGDAYNFVYQTLYNQHLLSGVKPDDIPGVIADAETNLSRQLFSQGSSPSEFLYQYAQSHGYKPAKNQEVEQKPKANKEAEARVEQLEKGKKATSPKPRGDGAHTPEEPSHSVTAFDKAFSEAFGFKKR
jgi:cell division protein FtsB